MLIIGTHFNASYQSFEMITLTTTQTQSLVSHANILGQTPGDDFKPFSFFLHAFGKWIKRLKSPPSLMQNPRIRGFGDAAPFDFALERHNILGHPPTPLAESVRSNEMVIHVPRFDWI